MKYTTKAKLRQYAATLVANMASFCIGTMLGWTSPMQPLLESDSPPVGNIPLTRAEVSWVGSINFIGAIIGTFFWGRLSDWLGRKCTGLIVAVPFAAGWMIILLAPNTAWLYVGRIVIGFGCSGTIINTPMFITEIADDAIRGALGSYLMFSLNLGVLFCYVIGAKTSFETLTSICFAIPGRKSAAEKAMRFYRGDDPVQAEKDITTLLNKPGRKNPGYRSLIESKGRIKGMLISFGFIAGQQFCGILAILTYTVTIFREAGSSISPYYAAIIVGGLQCVSSFASSMLVDKSGRRVLLMISYSTMAISLLTLGFYFVYKQSLGPEFAWIPILSLSLHVVSYSLGAGPIPFIVMAELFPPDIRGTATATIQLLGTSLSFASVKIYPSLTMLLGVDGCFLLYGFCCIALSGFTFFCVPETKGKTLQSIIRKLNGEPEDDVEMITNGILPIIMKSKDINGK